MKVLFLIESMEARDGGPPQIFASLMNSLVVDYADEITVASYRARSVEVPIVDGVRRHFFERSRVAPVSWIRAAHDLRRLLRDNDCAVVAGIWGPLEGLALRLANGSRKACVVIFGMMQPYILSRRPWRKRLGRWMYVNTNFKHARAVVVNSALERAQVSAAGIDSTRIAIAPIGVDLRIPDFSKAAVREDFGLGIHDRVALYLGRVHPKKGLDHFLVSFKELRDANPSWKLVVGGEYSDRSYRRRIEEEVRRLRLTDSVRFLGAVYGVDKWALYAAADIFVLPSHSEGFSMAVLEAMASRLPVLVTDGCNFPEVCSQGAGYVVGNNTEAFTKALFDVNRSYADLPKLGRNGRLFVEREYEISRVASFYRNLCASAEHA